MDMERATLIVEKTKKGKIIAKVKIVKDGKIVTVQDFSPENIEMNGMEVDVMREKGRPVLIQNGEKTLFDSRKLSDTRLREYRPPKKTSFDDKRLDDINQPKRNILSDDEYLATDHIEYVEQPAYAPYNFVPLNKKVITIDASEDDKDHKARPYGLKFDAYDDNYHTGWIDIQIETITPIFIRNSKEASVFYSPSGKPVIPGSSLRGMIRQMAEMVSYGKFGFFNDKKRLYYRGLADRSNLRNDYQSKMSSYDRSRKINAYKISAGTIRKEGLSYFIIPTAFDRIPKGEAKKLISKLGKNYEEFEFYDLKDSEQYKNHYLIVSGDMKNKKHDWLIKKADTIKGKSYQGEEIPISDDDIRNYKHDNTRKVLKDKDDNEIPSILNLIDLLDNELEKNNREFDEVPCFYVLWKDQEGKERVSFGHTAMFRLAYEKSIGDHIPKELIDDKVYDIAGAIFGNETDFAGRVFFDDAFLVQGQNEIYEGEKYIKILSAPKPTTFQHYLVQTEDHIKNRKHYDSNSSIRGNKMYWHKSGSNWEETNFDNIRKYPKQYKDSQINPVHAGIKFSGKIRFENLSAIELGALLFSLELPKGCCHKIGMGKPLGLGSVKISPKLYLSDRKKRYQNLFAEWNNDISEHDNKSFFTNIFEKHVLQEIGEKQTDSLWQTDRLKELLLMLHFDTGINLERENKIDYMDLQSFRNRSILPKPSQVSINAKTDPSSSIYIKEIEIDSLWDRYHIRWELNDDVNVLKGLNGSGKSTVLRLIKHVLTNLPFEKENFSIIPDMIKISYDNGKSSIYKSHYRLSEFKLEMLDKAITPKRTDEDAEKINLLKDWAKTEKIFEGKITFLAEVIKICGSEWVMQNKYDLLSECYDERNDLKIKDMSEYITNELIVTFDRYLPQEEIDKIIDKIKDNQSILDYDLETTHDYFITETNRLNIDEETDNLKALLKIVNTLFRDTRNSVSFNKTEGLFFTKNGKSIAMQELSSGEKQLIYILLKVFLGLIKSKPMILLLDEPEISLHPRWQFEFINHIKELNRNMQIIIASHSPAITFENWFNHETPMHTIMELRNEDR